MMKRIAAGVTAAAGLVSLALAQPASAALARPDYPIPGYLADCSGARGNVNAHRYSVNHNVPSRAYNTTGGMQNGTIRANSKIHIYYHANDENGREMWAMKTGTICGYLYQTDIVWNKSW